MATATFLVTRTRRCPSYKKDFPVGILIWGPSEIRIPKMKCPGHRITRLSHSRYLFRWCSLQLAEGQKHCLLDIGRDAIKRDFLSSPSPCPNSHPQFHTSISFPQVFLLALFFDHSSYYKACVVKANGLILTGITRAGKYYRLLIYSLFEEASGCGRWTRSLASELLVMWCKGTSGNAILKHSGLCRTVFKYMYL